MFLRAVNVLDDCLLAGDAIDGMQHSEAAARGPKRGQRFGGYLEDEMALTTPANARLVGKGLLRIGRSAARAISNRKSVFGFFDHAFADFRSVGSPILIPHQVSDGPQNLVALVADRAQPSADEVHGERAGF